MTPFTVLDREGDREVADTAEHPAVDEVHAEVLGPFFLDVEYVRMAVGAIEPLGVLLVGEERPRIDHLPFRLKAEDLVKGDRLEIRVEKALFRRDQAPFQRSYPVDLIAVLRLGKVFELRELCFRRPDLARMAASAGRVVDAKGQPPVVAGPAVISIPVLRLRDLRAVGLHREVQLEMADAAGIETPVHPMGKGHGRMRAAAGQSADQHIAVQGRGREYWVVPDRIELGARRYAVAALLAYARGCSAHHYGKEEHCTA